MYRMYRCAALMLTPPFVSHCPIPFYTCQSPFFTYLENQLLLLIVRIPIHSCPWFAINSSPLAASPTPRHPTDQVTSLHRRHQHQPSRLIHEQFSAKTYQSTGQNKILKNGRLRKSRYSRTLCQTKQMHKAH